MSDIKDKDIWIERDFSKRNTICYTKESIRHPAKMNLDMCRKIIKLYSKPGDVILDPMVGIGTTIIEGMILGRNVVGVEYEQKFADLVQQNIDKTNKSMGFMKSLGTGQVIKGDSRKLNELIKEKVNSVMFSPPFANGNVGGGIAKRMREGKKGEQDKYGGLNQAQPLSKDKNNIDNIKGYGEVDAIITSPPFVNANPNDKKQLANLEGKNYLTEMLIIYKECFKVLKQDGFMVLVIKNFVRAGVQIRLDLDTIRLCEAAGFKYIKRHYRLIKNPSFWITNAIQKWEKKHTGVPHPYPLEEDILVFKKSNGDDNVIF